MGLRQLYFLLGDLVEKLVYLKYGIAFILAFIGVKLVLHAMHANELPFINGGQHIEWAPEISTWVSLAVIIGSMAVAVIASLIKIRVDLSRGEIEESDLQPSIPPDDEAEALAAADPSLASREQGSPGDH